MEPVTPETLTEFLIRLGEKYTGHATIYLLGGSALLLLGNPRQTLDIDYTTDLDQLHQRELENIMNQFAAQFHLDVEFVPIEEFIPLPPGAESRRQFIGQYGNLVVFLYDLYTIALSKIARGFEPDLEDVVFLVKERLIDLSELKRYFEVVLPHASKTDIIPQEFQLYFLDLLRRLNEKA